MAESVATLVIIPALNEASALPETLRALSRAAPHLDILVVDDGSTDETSLVAREAGVRVARLPFNVGIGGALRAGFRFAIRHGYEAAVQFDADGQHEARDIERLLAQLDAGADLVIGTRFPSEAPTIRYRAGAVRSRAMAVLRILLRAVVGRRFTDTSSGFRAFSKPMIEFFARDYPVEYMESVEALLLACYAGFTVVETNVTMHPRSDGRPSHRNLALVYHYVRLVVALAAMASLRRRRLLKAEA